MCLILLMQLFNTVLAQQRPIVWHIDTNYASSEIADFGLEKHANWPLENDTLKNWISHFHSSGYIEASIDTIWLANDQIHLMLHLGPIYTWSYLDFSDVPHVVLDGVQLRDFQNKLFSYQEITLLFENILTRAERMGYPFAAVRLRQTGDRSGQIAAKLEVNLNDKIKIEKIKIEGDLKLSKRYLNHYLDISEGDTFNKQKIIRTQARLQELNFIKIKKEPIVEFLGDGATLQFYLDKKNANQFDILLGLLPTIGDDNPNRFQLTGNVNVDMQNQFGNGERLHFNYESLQPGTQELEIDLNYPFIFKLPFGTDMAFDLYKRDSSYIDVGYEVGLQYFLKRSNYLKFFIANESTNLLTVDTTQIKRNRKLPQFIDISNNQFGVEYHLENLDYRFNPRRGHDITFTASAGTRKIKPNSTIINISSAEDDPFDFSTLYAGFDLSSFKYQLQTKIQFYVPLFRSSALKVSNHLGYIGSGEVLYDNELFRIGGIKLLRGFNEEVIFASFYSVFSLEYRLLFNQNSNLFVFSDIAYTEQKTDLIRKFDLPIGLGTGLNLQTKVGIFSISYAIGGQRQNRLNFGSAKIHFGMVTSF